MATNKNEISVAVTANDEASSKLDQIADKVEALDGATAEVTVAAEGSEQVESTLTDVLALTQRLGTEDAQIVLALQAAGVKQELDDVLLDIAKINGTPVEIAANIERANELRSEFDQITDAITDLEARTIQIKIDTDVDEARRSLERARQDLDDLSGEKLDIDSKDFEAKMARAVNSVGDVADKVRAVGDEAVDITVSTKVDTSGIEEMRASLRLLGDDYRDIANTLRSLSESRPDLIHEDDIADAERLSAALQQASISGDQLGGAGSRAAQGINEVEASADSSKSVLANMVGNSTQDLASLGGVAGSAGVAIGQMGEYMADARAKGEGFGSILRNFGTVVAPIAALSIGIALATKAWNDYKQKQKEVEEATRKTVEGIEEATDVVDDFADRFNDATSAYEGFADVLLGDEEGRDKLVGFLADLNLTLKDLPGLISAITSGDATQIGNLIRELGGSDEAADAVAKLVGEGVKLSKLNSNADLIPWVRELGDESAAVVFAIAGIADEINGLQPNEAASRTLDAIATSSPKARDEIKRLRAEMVGATEVEILNAYIIGLDKQTDAYKRQRGPLHSVTRLTQDLIDAQHGYVDGINDQVDAALAAAQAGLDRAAEIQEQIQDEIDRKVAIGESAAALRDLADAQDELEAGALADALDLGDNRLDTLTTVQAINEEVRDLAEFLKDPKGLAGRIPDIFDANDVDASEFLNKVASLRGPIQEEIARVFGESGATAAQAVADTFVERIAKQTGLSEGQVRGILGIPEELSILIKPAIDKSDEAIARRMLDILSSIPNEGLVALGIETDLNNKKITPQQARLEVQRAFEDLGFDIPVNLVVPDPDQVVRDAEAAMSGRSVTVPVRYQVVGGAQGLQSVQSAIPSGSFQPVTNNNTIIYPNGATPPVVAGAITIDYNRNGDRQPT